MKKIRVVIFFSWVYVFNFTAFIHFFNITFLRNYKIIFNLECQAANFAADPVMLSFLLGGMSTGPAGHSSY